MLYDWTAKERSADQLAIELINVRDIDKSNLIEVVTHPGFNDSYLTKISGLNRERATEHAQLIQLSKSDFYEKNGFELVSFGAV